MRITFFVRSLNEARGGGSHHNAIAMIRALRERGHEVRVHAFEALDNEPPADISLIEHEGAGKSARAASAYLADLLRTREQDSDVCLLYGVDFTWGGGLYRKAGGRTPVCVYLDTYLFSMGYMREDTFSAWRQHWYQLRRLLWDATVGRRLAQRIDAFLAVSPFVRDAYVHFGFPAAAFSVVPNFFDPIVPHRTARSDTTVRLLYSGRLTHDKGVDRLLHALARLADTPWTLRIVGDGPQRVALEVLARELQLHEQVTFVPWSAPETLASAYDAADIFVHPARWPEPFGRTIVEALQHGVPVIVPERGGASWIAGDAGITFENGDEAAFAEALRRLMHDDGLRMTLAARAPARVAAFAAATILPQLEAALQRAASR